MFGICNEVEAFPEGYFGPSLYPGHAYLTIGGAGRVYWFLFENIPETAYLADKVPRLTKEEEKKLAEKYWDDNLADNVKFGELYSKSICVNTTAIHEHIFDKWHFQRMITIGDSAHKVGTRTFRGTMRRVDPG